ncbi:zinc ribbon domain-containing protein [Leifsonia flava]|uniref:Zinc ribbon domain-containing protein n=1 Tax=Orlajensenia leifsoniae TaxID=2561933 RepID=A0A4Y9QZB0_9MICO|nr:zinc ribbon domain-containing protein [Leifsonia flava]TFV96355.1 zinc ribbon domain-containing protein [Leifsonia flava]
MAWSDDAARYLLDTTICPRCGASVVGVAVCPSCGADLGSAAAQNAWSWSQKAAFAIERRAASIAEIPDAAPAPAAGRAPVPVAMGAVASASASASAVAASPPVASGATAPVVPGVVPPRVAASGARFDSQISLQSVLAVAGAGLVAVAAIVFTFLNPDLDFGARTVIIAVCTAAFLGGAWLLARRGLTFSSEAIGGLGMVFVALDVWSFSELAPENVSGWWFAALGLLVASGTMVVVAAIVRLRTWLWAGLLGLAVVPAFLGYAATDVGDTGVNAVVDVGAWAVVGHLGVGFAAVVLHRVVRRLRARFTSALAADRIALQVLQVLVVFLVVVQAPWVAFVRNATATAEAVGIAAAYAALAALALLSARSGLPRFWSALAGVLSAGALAVLVQAPDLGDGRWWPALVPVAAGLVLVAISVVPTAASVDRTALRTGTLVTTLLFAVPAFAVAVGGAIATVIGGAASDDGDYAVFGRTFFGGYATEQLAAVVGLVAVGVAIWAAARLSPAEPWRILTDPLVAARWIAAVGVVTFPAWSQLQPWARSAEALALAALAGVVLLVVPRVRDSRLALRLPGIVGAHAVLVLAVVLSWPEQRLAVVAGAAAVALTVLLAHTVPVVLRPAHMGVGFAYALVVTGLALDLAGLDTVPVLCLTTTVAALAALAATLTRWLRPGTWYAVLIVTSVPFLVGIAGVLQERSAWTALSTGVTALLAFALTTTRRPGLTVLVRAVAAAVIVPSLAVVVVCLCAAFLPTSGSPVALPIIAVIVAAVLPSTGVIQSALERAGSAPREARAVRLAIEGSALLTGALAVLIALVGVAGLETAFVVLLVIGIGAAATGMWVRRYGWWIAAAAWTGALWCRWAIAGVDVVEPYVLPPALVAALVGTILVARGRRGVPLATTGLASAVVPSLVALAVSGSGVDAAAPWRTLALFGAAAALLVLLALITRPSGEPRTRLAALGLPVAVIAIAAAGAGAVQGMRYGLEFDLLPGISDAALMVTVLGYAVAACLLAATAGRLLVRAGARSRWGYAAASVYLVAGPITAVRDDPFSIWTLWTLAVLLLALVVITAVRAQSHATTLPPVWFLWAVAWCTSVAGWSEREILRVEGFSIPLALGLLLAGIVAMGHGATDAADPASAPPRSTSVLGRLNAWPTGFSGSWRLLGPGLIVLLVPSMMATVTDPTTWRAILVIALALAAILVGARRRLAAPFIIGLVVLPVENVLVFAVQLGRDIQSLPWWITLATAGAVLLVIAVGSERREGSDKGVAARMRDLT